MSRSKKHSPFEKWGSRKEQKWWKRNANKSLRQAFRMTISRDPECSTPPLLREVSNEYNFPSDGSPHYCGHIKYPKWDEYRYEWDERFGPEAYARLMRK